MRTVILLLFMVLSTANFAKNTTHKTAIKTPGVSLKSIEKSILNKQYGTEFNGPNSVINSSYLSPPVEASFYLNEHLFFSDQFFNFEEFSYKNNALGGGSSVLIFDANTAISEKTSIDTVTIFQQGLFYGFVATLIILNLVCFFLFDEKTFLLYSLVITGTAMLLFLSDDLFNLLGMHTFESVSMVQSLLLFIAVMCTAVFTEKYLNLKEFAPKMKWTGLSLLSIAAVAIIFNAITPKFFFSTLTNSTLFALLFVYFMAGVYLFSKKNYAKFYVIATFIPLLFGFDFFVLSPLGIEFLSTQTSHIKVAVISEMLILTYANMYRMQAMKEENALRQIEMRIFLKRQEALNTRQKTEKLVEDVYLENLIMHYDLDGLEIKLLQYISEGKDNAKIARKLSTTETEIEEMTKELYEKLEIGEQIQQDYRMVEQQPDYIYN
ncbi:MAG: 7TM-DISM domain-containing protein [Flavobacteriaceae bacterium]